MPPFKKQKEDMTLPERREMIDWLKNEIRQFKEDIALHPTVEALRLHLLQHEVKLAWLEGEDKKAFFRNARLLAEKVQRPDYPYSIKTWYEDDFRKLVEEYGDEQ